MPAIIWAIFLPSLKHGLPGPIPLYQRVFLEIAVFYGMWKWLLLLPLFGVGIAFTVIELASPGVRK
jgi:hypothetical protein